MSRLVLISGAVATTMAASESSYGAASPLPIVGTQPVGTQPVGTQPVGTHPVGTQDASPVARRLANILEAGQIDQLNSEVASALREIGNAGQEDIERRRAEESTAGLKCTNWPSGDTSLTKEERCLRGNSLGDSFVYVYNEGRGTSDAKCGELRCHCCRKAELQTESTQYVTSDSNDVPCPRDAQLTREQCEAAGAESTQYAWDGDRDWDNRLPGCQLSINDGEVNWNINEDGAGLSSDQRPLCRKPQEKEAKLKGEEEPTKESISPLLELFSSEESISELLMDKLREAIANALAGQEPPKNLRERIARRARDATIETAISALEAQAQKKEDELRELVRVNREEAREFVTTEAEEWREFFEENVAEAKDLIAENVAEFKELLLDPSLPATRKFLKENAEELKEYLGEQWEEGNEFLENQVEDALQFLKENAGEARDFINANVEWLAENVQRVVGLANLLGFEHKALDALEDFADNPQAFFAEYARKFLEENAKEVEEFKEALEDEVEEILEGAKAEAREAVEDFATKVSESELGRTARAVHGKVKSVLEAAGKIRDLLDRLGITFFVGDLSKGNAKTDFIEDSTRGSHSSAQSTMDRFRKAEEVDDMQRFMNGFRN